MNIKINGVMRKVDSSTLDELVDELQLSRSSLVIELNATIIKQELWQNTLLQANDSLELLNFVGGG